MKAAIDEAREGRNRKLTPRRSKSATAEIAQAFSRKMMTGTTRLCALQQV
jgi:hypothetical protein